MSNGTHNVGRQVGEDSSMEIIVPTPRLPFTADALRRWLRRELSDGPLPLDDLADRLALHQGLESTDAAELIDLGIEDDGGMVFVGPEDEAVMLLEKLVHGITFTHRITAVEAETGVVRAFPDFAVPLMILPSEDGRQAESTGPGVLTGLDGVAWGECDLPENPTRTDHLGSVGVLNRAIVGPTGWLRNGSSLLVALTGTSSGWRVSLTDASTSPSFDATLRASLDSAVLAISGEESGRVIDVVLEGVTGAVGIDGTDRTGWVAPISEVVEAAGRSIHLNLIGGPRVDWETYDHRRMYEMFANIWAVTPTVAKAMMGTMDVVQAARRGEPSSIESRRALTANLATPGVVEGLAENVIRDFRRRSSDAPLADEATDDDRDLSNAIAAMLADAAKDTSGTTRARIDWLASRLAPDVSTAQALLRNAARNDARVLAVHDDLVWFAAVNAYDGAGRAKLDIALQDWVAAGGVSRAVIQNQESASPRQVLRFACSAVRRGTVRNSGPSVGRNDPCPCGSGRKYKQCHNGKSIDTDDASPTSIAVRSMVPWVQALQLLWFERTNQRYFAELVEELDAVPEADQRNMITTFVVDADVSDRMRTEDFLETVLGDGAIWPNGLATIVRSWADRPFGLYEVEDRVVGKSLWIRDLRSGERSIIEAPETSRHYGVGAMFLSRLVDNGDAVQMSFGCMQIAFRDRDRTLEMLDLSNGRPDAFTLAQFVSGGDQVRPTAGDRIMRNTDSDEIVIHRSLVRAGRPVTVDAVSAAFAEHGDLEVVEPDNDGSAETWHVIGSGGLGHTIRGAIQVGNSSDGVWLLVETNSVRRHDEALALVRAAIGDFEELDATIDDIEDREFAEDFADLGLDVPTMTPLGIRGGSDAEMTPYVMAEIAVQMEERWMSEGVPALGGLTPRQAADDPTRRRDLVALLESFPPSMPGMITFDPHRLAAALGVDIG